MPLIPCEVSEGLRASERTVKVTDYRGTPQYLRVEAGMIAVRDGVDYLPVGYVMAGAGNGFDHGQGWIHLVELPHAADSGVSRLWVADAAILPDDAGEG